MWILHEAYVYTRHTRRSGNPVLDAEEHISSAMCVSFQLDTSGSGLVNVQMVNESLPCDGNENTIIGQCEIQFSLKHSRYCSKN